MYAGSFGEKLVLQFRTVDHASLTLMIWLIDKGICTLSIVYSVIFSPVYFFAIFMVGKLKCKIETAVTKHLYWKQTTELKFCENKKIYHEWR